MLTAPRRRLMGKQGKTALPPKPRLSVIISNDRGIHANDWDWFHLDVLGSALRDGEPVLITSGGAGLPSRSRMARHGAAWRAWAASGLRALLVGHN